MLSKDDVHDVLVAALNHEKFSIEKYSISEVNTFNFHAETNLLEVEATVCDEPTQKLSFFLKSVNHGSVWYRRYLAHTNVFTKEHEMVTGLIPELETVASGKITAKCYLSKPNQLMVFENLSEYGFKTCCGLLDLEHARVGIDALANLHAASILMVELKGIRLEEKYKDNLQELLFVFHEELDESIMMAAHNRLRAIARRLFVDVEEKIQDEVFEKMKKTITELVQPSAKFRNVLIQGDPWGGNIMYRYKGTKPEEAILVDFQTVRYVPPAQELALFLQLALPGDLEIHHDSLKKLYYDRLESILNLRNVDLSRIISEKEFSDSYDFYKEFAVSTSLYYAINMHLPIQQLRLAVDDPESFCDYIIGGCLKMAFDAYDNYPDYKRNIDEALTKAFKFYNAL